MKRGGYILQKLRGHDEEIHSLVWCPVPGEEFKPAAGKQQDITDLETFGVGKYDTVMFVNTDSVTVAGMNFDIFSVTGNSSINL